jgi:hypothetical protein
MPPDFLSEFCPHPLHTQHILRFVVFTINDVYSPKMNEENGLIN